MRACRCAAATWWWRGAPGSRAAARARRLVAQLADGGAAALAFVDGHYLPGALAGVRHAADEHGLPLFALPRGADAAAAAAEIGAALAGGGAAAAGRALRAGAALARAARDGGTPAIVAALADATGLGAALQDDAGQRLAAAGRGDGRPVAAVPVPGGELALYGANAGALAEPLLEQAAALVALEAGRGDPAAAERARREADAVRRALDSGAPWDEPVVVLVVAGGEPAVTDLLRSELGATCGAADDDLVALLPAPADVAAVTRIAAGAAWGAGGASTDVAAGLREARTARALGPAVGRPPTYDAVRALDALLRAFGPDGIRDLRARVLGPLPPEVASTLAAYIESGLSVAGAAGLLFVHKNTVRYRLKRAEILSGRRLDDLADRLELETAILGNFVKRSP